MNCETALMHLREGKWIRRAGWRCRNAFIVHRNTPPPLWVANFDGDLMMVSLEDWVWDDTCPLKYETIGPTELDDEDKAATDWEAFEIGQPLDPMEWLLAPGEMKSRNTDDGGTSGQNDRD